jgi:hypothetical protein
MNGNISKSYSNANIFSGGADGGYVGGIVGYIRDVGSSISKSYSTGNVISSGGYATGGIVGTIGAIYDTTDIISITDSYSTGNISSSGFTSGGIAGFIGPHSLIDKSYSTGTVGAGGIVGFGGGLSYITNCAAANQVVSIGNRIMGTKDYDKYGSVTAMINNFANADMLVNNAIVADSEDNGIGKSLTELQTNSSFAYERTHGGLGWIFGNDDDNPWVWGAFDDYPYPTLYWQTQRP